MCPNKTNNLSTVTRRPISFQFPKVSQLLNLSITKLSCLYSTPTCRLQILPPFVTVLDKAICLGNWLSCFSFPFVSLLDNNKKHILYSTWARSFEIASLCDFRRTSRLVWSKFSLKYLFFENDNLSIVILLKWNC